MDTNEYLALSRDLYFQAIHSDEPPEMLRDFGGALSLAGADAEEIRFEKNGYLGFIDRLRTPDERMQAARTKWRDHAADVRQRVARGVDVEHAFYSHTQAATGIEGRHFKPQQLIQKTQMMIGAQFGERPAWLYDIATDRARFMSELEVVTDTIPAAAAAVDYGMARLKHRSASASPAEHDAQEAGDMQDALGTGRAWKPIGNLATALAGVVGARGTVGAMTHPAPRPRIIDTTPQPNELRLAGRPSDARGIGDRSTHPSQNGTRPVARLSPQQPTAASTAAAVPDPVRPTRTRGIRMPLVERAAQMTERFDKLSRDPETFRALVDMFRRSTGFSLDGRVLTFLQSRAAASELMTLVRLLTDDNVASVRAIASRNDMRTPDYEVTMRATADAPPSTPPPTVRVEVTALTRATVRQRPAAVTGGSTRPTPRQPLSPTVDAIVRKATDTPTRRSQLAGGGVLALNALFNPTDVRAWAVDEVRALNEYMDRHGANWPHLQSVQFSSLGERSGVLEPIGRQMIEAVRDATGRYRLTDAPAAGAPSASPPRSLP